MKIKLQIIIVLFILLSGFIFYRANTDTYNLAKELEGMDGQAQEAKKEPEEEVETPLPAEVHMQGYVKRSDGKKNTVWVNHQALQENAGNADVQIGTLSTKFKSKGKLDGADEVRLKLPGNGQNFNLKAGQRYLPDENRVVDLSTKPILEKMPNDEIILRSKNNDGSKNAR